MLFYIVFYFFGTKVFSVPFSSAIMTHIISASYHPSDKMINKTETIMNTLGTKIKWQIIKPDSPIQLTEITSSQYATMKKVDILIRIPLNDSYIDSFIEFHDHCLVSISISKELLEKLFEVRIITVADKGPYIYIYSSLDNNNVNISNDDIALIKLLNKCLGHRFTAVTPASSFFYSQIYRIQTDKNIVQLTPNFREIAYIPPSLFYNCSKEQLGEFRTNDELNTSETVTDYYMPPGFDFVDRPENATYGIPVTTYDTKPSQYYCFVIKRFGCTDDDESNQGWIVRFDNYHMKFFNFDIMDGYLYCTGYKRRPHAAPETYNFPCAVFQHSVLMQTHKIQEKWGQVYQIV